MDFGILDELKYTMQRLDFYIKHLSQVNVNELSDEKNLNLYFMYVENIQQYMSEAKQHLEEI